MAGSLGRAIFAFLAGHVLQLTRSYARLFVIAATAYLLALVILCSLASGLKKVEFIACSLYCAKGTLETDLVPQQLRDLLVESLAKLGARTRVLVVPPYLDRWLETAVKPRV